jgi:hypothetical protein
MDTDYKDLTQDISANLASILRRWPAVAAFNEFSELQKV